MFNELHGRDVVPLHPGEIIADDLLPRVGLTRRTLAQRLGVSSRTLSELLSGRRSVTLDLAVRLDRVLGLGARYWLGAQMQYDLWLLKSSPVGAGAK